MASKMKRFLSLMLALIMVFGLFPANVFAAEAPITGTITEDTVWNDGDVIGGVTIADDVTITVKGTVKVSGTIKLSPDAICNVVFNGENDAKLIRTADFAGQMFYAEGVSGNFQNLTFNSITLDGGAVWTGDVDKTLNRGTVNEGVKATGSVLYLAYANAELNNSTLQNHEDSTGEKANAVFLRYYSTVAFNDSVVRNNNSISTYYRGGVVTVRQGGTVTTNNADVYGNSGPNGGFFSVSSTGSYGGVAEVYNSKFHNNYSDNGAVFLMQCNSNRGYLLIDGCEFYNNASKTAVLSEWAYSRPFIIRDSYFHDNECAVWDCHTDPILDISGNFKVEEDADYTKYLYETALGIGGSLDASAKIPVSDASYAKLMKNSGCLMTEVPTDNYYNPTSKYTIQPSDMEKMVWNNPSNLVLIKTDVDGNGMLDVVPVNDVATTNVKLYENFLMDSELESNRLEVQAVSDVVNNIPVAVWFHEGFYFTGWAEAANGEIKYSNKSNAATYAEGTVLYATWNMQDLELKLSSKDASDPYCNTLKVTVNNKNTEGKIAYTYQWYKDGVAIEGATADEYTFSETATYKCVVTASAPGFEAITAEVSKSATYKEAPKVYVAEIAETGDKYETLAEAVAAANERGTATVNLLADITLGEKLTVTGDVTIQGAHSITRADDYGNTLFTVNAGASLTLDGGLVIDGNNNWTYKDGKPELIPGGDSFMSEQVDPAEGGVNATAYMIENFGTLNVNKVTIQNQYSTNDAGVIKGRTDSVTTIDGATIQHIASNECGAVVQIGRNNVTSNNATLTIKGDTKITGNMGAYNGGIIMMHSQGNTFNFEGGSIDNNYVVAAGTVFMSWAASSTNKNTVNISGGFITENEAEGYGPVYIHTNTEWNMSGGEISENLSYYPNYVRSNNCGSITGGRIVNNKLYIDYAYTQLRIASGSAPNLPITGGTFTQDVVEWVPEGYGVALEILEENGEEVIYHTVTDQIVKLERTGVIYHSIRTAMADAQDGDTLTVLASHRIDDTSVILDKDVTINLGGKTIYGWGTINPVFRVQADVTFTGEGTVDSRKLADSYGFILGASDGSVAGNLTIQGGTYLSDVSVASVTKGTLNIEGGQFAVTPYEESYAYTLNCIDANYKDGSAVINVTGGTFYMFDPDNNEAEGANTDFVPKTHYSNEDTENYWTVYKTYNYVAEVVETGVQYESLAEAVAAANERGTATVNLLADVTLGENLTVTGNVTIQGAHTITRDDAYTGTLFTVPVGASLTLDGDLVIDGGNKWTLNEETYNKALAMKVQGVTRADLVSSEEGAPNATAAMFVVNGSVVAKDVTIQNNYSTKDSNSGDGGVFKVAANASLTMEGATIKHIATGGANSVAYLASNAVWTINDGTLISDTFAARNGGVCRNDSGLIVMNGGEIKDNKSLNTNGTVFMMYNGSFEMNGGTICGNSGVSGNNNGRCAAIYLHANGVMTMNGGTICHNTGISYGGIDTNKSSSRLTINNGNVYYNTSVLGNANHDINDRYTLDDGSIAYNNNYVITGGWYSHDVTKWVPEDYGVIVHEGMGENGVTLYQVAPAITVTFDSFEIKLGDELPEFTYTYKGGLEGDEFMLVVPTPDVNVDGVGEYEISSDAYLFMNDKYVVKVVPGKLTVYQELAKVEVEMIPGVWGSSIITTLNWADLVAAVGPDNTLPVKVTMLNDWNLTEPLVVDNGTVVLDMAGYDITTTGDVYPVIRVQGDADMTVTGDGTITNSDYVFVLGASDGSSAGNLTIESGKFYGDTTVASVTKGELKVSGGYFEAEPYNGSCEFTLNCVDANYRDGSAKISLTGGTYKSFDPENCAAEGTGTDFCAQNYVSIDNGDGTWTVVNYIEWIKAELLAGNNVTLEKDIVVDGSYVESIPASTNGNGKYPNFAIFTVIKDTVTFDLNGHTITYNGHEDWEWNGKTYSSCASAHGLFYANDHADLTIVDTSEDQSGTVMVHGLASALYVASPDTTLTVTGGSWYNDGCGECGGTNLFLYPLQGGKLYITGGFFEQALDGNGDSYLMVQHGGEYKNSVIDYALTDIEITGGTFAGMNPEQAKYFQQTADNKLVTGSTVNACANGYFAIPTSDENNKWIEGNTWIVVDAVEAGYVCWNMQTGVYYETVSAGLEEAQANETVQLLTSTSDNYVLVTPATTLDLNGWTLTANYVVGFNTSAICDSTNNKANDYKANGLLVVKPDNMVLYEGNGAVPVYNPEKGGYIFVDFLFQSKVVQGDDIYTVNMLVTTRTMEVIELLKNGAVDNDIQIVIRLTWDNPTGTSYQDFVFNEEMVAEVMNSNNGLFNQYELMFILKITGVDGLENMTATAMVIAGSNAIDSANPVDVK